MKNSKKQKKPNNKLGKMNYTKGLTRKNFFLTKNAKSLLPKFIFILIQIEKIAFI